jgi:hypothetical protein
MSKFEVRLWGSHSWLQPPSGGSLRAGDIGVEIKPPGEPPSSPQIGR